VLAKGHFSSRDGAIAEKFLLVRRQYVSTELQEAEHKDIAPTALDEVRATENECNEFFGGVFDELQSLSLELFARHRCLEVSSEQNSTTDIALVACRDDVRRVTDQMERLATNVDNQLGQLTALVKDIATVRSDNGGADTQIAALLEGMRWQQADWMQQRAALESEVETLRAQALEQSEALHEQRRQATRQQSELSGELKRMRSLLETLGAQIRCDPSLTMAGLADGKRPPGDAFMLNSVLAQYQMMQRDSSHRNGTRSAEPAPPAEVPGEAEK
jgi:hypothetical protein